MENTLSSPVAGDGLVRLEHARAKALYGGKCFSLGEMMRDGLPVPPGYALSPDFAHSAARCDADALQALDGIVEELGGVVAVRSSGIGEDGVDTSFAGQHATVLGVVSKDELVDAIRTVVASAATEEAKGYRDAMSIEQCDDIAIAIQKLAKPDFAGVMFTRNPVDGADERVIESVFGLGEALVSGMVSPAQFRVSNAGETLSEMPGYQEVRLDFEPGKGVVENALPEDQQEALMLSGSHLADLHRLAGECVRVFGSPQDIEWCIEMGETYLLQSRPITTL